MLAWCLGTRSSTWRARPWCSPMRPPRKAPLGCRPGTWRCKYLILIQIIHRLFRRREMCQNNFNWKIIWFKILLDFWAQFNPVCSCSAAHILCWHRVQSPQSSMIIDQHILMSVWASPCHSDHVPGPADLLLEGGPALQPHVGPGEPQLSVTKILPGEDKFWKWFFALFKIRTLPANTREVWRGRRRWERWD